MTAVELKKQIYTLRALPTLPIVARKLLLVADDESNSFQALAGIVKRDQSLTAKVLGLANSAYYGRRGEVRTLNNAISILGITLLKQLSLCAFVIHSWGSKGDNHASFWKHSIAVAYAASFVAGGCDARLNVEHHRRWPFFWSARPLSEGPWKLSALPVELRVGKEVFPGPIEGCDVRYLLQDRAL